MVKLFNTVDSVILSFSTNSLSLFKGGGGGVLVKLGNFGFFKHFSIQLQIALSKKQ